MPDASHDFGGYLRQAREQKGISLRQIADRTKISVPALEALERNDISRLPGGIFTRAFVRAYAVEIDLDPEEAVRRFLARFPDESVPSAEAYEANPDHIEVDEPPTFGRAWRMVVWSVPLLLVVAYFGFGGRLPLWRDHGAAPQAKATAPGSGGGTPGALPTVPPPPQNAAAAPAAIDPAASAQPAPESTAAAEPGVVPEGAAVSSAPSQPSAAATPAAVPAAAAPAPPSAQAPAAEPPPAGGIRLVLAPREACWVSVRVNGASVYSQLMRPGERKEITLHGEATLTVGNAGAFAFMLDDQPGRSLGGPGQVVTTKLNAETIKSLIEPR